MLDLNFSDGSLFARDRRHTLLGSILVVALVAGGLVLSGRLSSYEARELTAAALPSLRFLTSAVMTVTATILALKLTLISFSYTLDYQLKSTFYQRIKLSALVTTICFVLATVLLALTSVPIAESDNVPDAWFKVIYYIAIFSSALLAGTLVSVAVMIYYALRSMMSLIAPEDQQAPNIVMQQEGERSAG